MAHMDENLNRSCEEAAADISGFCNSPCDVPRETEFDIPDEYEGFLGLHFLAQTTFEDEDLGFHFLAETTFEVEEPPTNEQPNLKTRKCHFCGFETSKKSTLDRHIDGVHLNLRNYKCHLCDLATTRESDLKRHVDTVHLKLKKHKCHLCEYAADRMDRVRKHIQAVHKDEASESNVEWPINHASTRDSDHLKYRKNKCDLCEYSADRADRLKKHIQTVHLNLRKHRCHLCEFSSSRKDRLNKHIQNIHKDEASKNQDTKNQKCHLCEYTSNRAVNVERHISHVHSKLDNGVEAYRHECRFCDFCAEDKDDLKKHMDGEHKDLRRHKCHLCKYISNRVSNLKRHISLVHLK